MANEKIGLFGGTFNPIHYGHLNSMESVAEKLKLDKVLVIPACQNPLRAKTEGPTPQERLQMAKLAVGTLDGDLIQVSDNEIKRGGDSYTIDTLKELSKEHASADFFLIIGGDNLNSFDGWKDFEDIISMSNIVFTSRPGNELPKTERRLPSWLKDRLGDFDLNTGLFKTGKTLHFVQLDDVDISSTEIRRHARRGLDVRKYTHPVVDDYIKEHQIYDRVGKKIPDFVEFTKYCAKILDDKGAINIQAFDVSKIEQPTDYTIVCSGTSSRHVLSLMDYVSHGVKDDFGVYPQGLEGNQDGRWVIVDYGGLMIHIFYDFIRNEYQLEDLWREGKRIEL